MTYRITQTVIDVLTLLARYRYLRKSFIDDLLADRSQQGMNRTLKRMLDVGLIARPRAQYRGYNSLHCCRIYEITTKGWQCLRDRDVSQVTHLVRTRQDGPPKQFTHAMMICDALASIEIGVHEAGHDFIPLGAILERTSAPHPLRLPCRVAGRNAYITPDGVFGIRQSGKACFYAFEAEHYNPVWPAKDLRRASFRRKVLAYAQIAQSRPYRDRLNIPNLHYLFVFPSEARAQTAFDCASSAFSETDFFQRLYVTAIPVQEELLHAPPPFPELYRTRWLGAGRLDRD